MHQVRLAQTHAAIEKERVVRTRRGFCDGLRRRVSPKIAKSNGFFK